MYCTYLTIYSGNLLPPFYIGYTSISRIESGYNGTVTSQRYGTIWKSERKVNKHLFKTIILKQFHNRKEALLAECQLHEKLKVDKNPLYINQSCQKSDGFTCIGHSKESRKRMSETRKGRKGPNLGRVLTEEWKENISKGNKGKPKSETTKKKMSESFKTRRWWTNGIIDKFTSEYLGEGWRRGMRKNPNRKGFLPGNQYRFNPKNHDIPAKHDN